MMSLVTNLALANLKCAERLANRPAQKSYDFRKSLLEKGLNSDQLRFEVISQRFGSGEKVLLIEINYGHRLAGRFTMAYIARENRFDSHPHIEEGFKGRGLGLMMYVMGAKIAQKHYNSTLTSSWNPSADAQNVWNWIVKNNWGEQIPENFGRRILNKFVFQSSSKNQFRFKNRVARSFGLFMNALTFIKSSRDITFHT